MLGITEKEVGLRLAVDNPWWRDAALFQEDMSDLPRRDLFTSFHALLTNLSIRRAPILMGPRRVGKSVLIRQVIAQLLADGVPATDILYVSLDTPVYTGLFMEQILRIAFSQDGMLDRRTRYVFYDEVQYLKDWERHLKSLVDALPHIRFCASGSAAAALKMKSNESGAGRFTDFYLPGLSFAEFVRFTSPEEFAAIIPLVDRFFDSKSMEGTSVARLNSLFIDYINFGGFPEPTQSPEVRRRAEIYVREDILNKVLLRDLPSLYGIDDIQELNRLFTMLAYQTGKEISLDGLSQQSSVAKNTLRKYLSYLEAAFLIVRLPRIDAAGQRFRRENFFKIHLTIPSLRAALFGSVTGDEEHFGELVETAILAQFVHTNDIPNQCYARWGKGEIDLVRLDPANGHPEGCVEVKWSDRYATRPEEMNALLEFAATNKVEALFASTRSVFVKTSVRGLSIWQLPASVLALVIGYRTLNDPDWQLNSAAVMASNIHSSGQIT